MNFVTYMHFMRNFKITILISLNEHEKITRKLNVISSAH